MSKHQRLEKTSHNSGNKYEFTDFGLTYVKHLPTKHGDILVKFYGISLSWGLPEMGHWNERFHQCSGVISSEARMRLCHP